MLLVRFEELYFRKELNLAQAASRKCLTSQTFHLSEPLPSPRALSKKIGAMWSKQGGFVLFEKWVRWSANRQERRSLGFVGDTSPRRLGYTDSLQKPTAERPKTPDLNLLTRKE